LGGVEINLTLQAVILSDSLKKMRVILIVLLGLLGERSMAQTDSLSPRLKRDESALPNAGSVVLSYRDAVSAIKDSVVTVLVKQWKPKAQWDESAYDMMPQGRVERDLRKSGFGTGIVLTAEGLVMTNYHVVNGAQEILLRVRGSTTDVPAEIVGMDAATDVALLRAKSGDWQAATLTNSDLMQSGDVVLALGSPFGLEQTVTLGIVSATGRADIHGVASSLQDFIQTDAAINPGNSGGPLVDGRGRVVGMNTARYGGEGIGLAIPINLALKVADDLLKGGRVKRGLIGVRLVDVDSDVIAELKLNSAVKGAVVMHVEEGQPAAKAGLLPGDVIVAVNGQAVTSRARFLMRMTTLKAGDAVKISYFRASQQHEVEATLIDAPVNAPPPTFEWELLPGLKVALVDEKVRNKLLLRGDFHALLVQEDYKTDEGVLKLSAGDFILKVNGMRIVLLPDGVAPDHFTAPTLNEFSKQVVYTAKPRGINFGPAESDNRNEALWKGSSTLADELGAWIKNADGSLQNSIGIASAHQLWLDGSPLPGSSLGLFAFQEDKEALQAPKSQFNYRGFSLDEKVTVTRSPGRSADQQMPIIIDHITNQQAEPRTIKLAFVSSFAESIKALYDAKGQPIEPNAVPRMARELGGCLIVEFDGPTRPATLLAFYQEGAAAEPKVSWPGPKLLKLEYEVTVPPRSGVQFWHGATQRPLASFDSVTAPFTGCLPFQRKPTPAGSDVLMNVQ